MNACDSLPKTSKNQEDTAKHDPLPAPPPNAKGFGLKKLSTLAPPKQAQMMVEKQEREIFVSNIFRYRK
jgi:hypothetical protein